MQLYDAQLIYNNLVNNFEFAEIRDTQKKLLKFLAKSLVDKKFIFIEAPPGTGKTAVAVALAKSFKNAYYLCSTKSLQDQLKSDYTDCIKYIKGRSNYECIIHTYSKDQFLTIKKNEYTDSSAYKSIDKYYEPYKSLIADQSCASCFCKFVGCNKCNYCPYLISKSEALSHPITCANYSWYFYYKLYSDKTIAKNLIICDEAHNVINSLIGLSEWRLSQKICDAHSYNFKLSDYDLSNISELDLMYLLNSKFKRILGQRISLLELIERKSYGNFEEFMKVRNEIAYSKDLYYKVSQLVDIKDWIIYTEYDEELNEHRIVVKPMDIKKYFKRIFDTDNNCRVLFMSATLGGFGGYISMCSELGIDTANTSYCDVPSTFNPANRPIVRCYGGILSESNYTTNIEKCLLQVEDILNIHNDVKGIIHCSSYELVNRLKVYLDNPRLLICTYTNKEHMLKKHIESDDPTVIVSATMWEGIDLKDDLGRFNIVIRLPFASPDDLYIKKRSESNAAYPIFLMSQKLVQSYGRTTRSVQDYSTFYVLDSRFDYFLNHYNDHFPKYFVEAITPENTFTKILYNKLAI